MAMSMESDEDFARRLQAEENGELYSINRNINAVNGAVNGSNSTASLRPGFMRLSTNIARSDDREVNRGNPTVFNARLNDLNSSRATVFVLLFVNTPQVLAAIIVLWMHWNDSNVCDQLHTERWKWWGSLAALRMFSYTSTIVYMYLYRIELEGNQELNLKVNNFRNALDAFGLIWFVVGNMWLFGGDDDDCTNANKSPIYNLCISMLIINYIQICLPCILAILFIPIFCFCMPCLIRLLARLQDPRAAVGASDSVIETLPEMTLTQEDIAARSSEGDSSSISCPICLNEMAVGDSARSLRCNHLFHKACVDEWLRVNASCPTCRKRVVDPVNSSGDRETEGDSQVELSDHSSHSHIDIDIGTGQENRSLLPRVTFTRN